MRAAILVLLVLLACALLVAAGWYGGEIPFAEQWPLYEALRNTAAIIFAVVGAWLAIIYPERLKLSFGKEADAQAPAPNIGLLLTPAVMSTGILVILLLVGVLAPILKQVPYLVAHVSVMRSASFVLLTALTLWQVIIVVIAILPVDLLLSQVSKEQAVREIDEHYGSLRRQRKPPANRDDNG